MKLGLPLRPGALAIRSAVALGLISVAALVLVLGGEDTLVAQMPAPNCMNDQWNAGAPNNKGNLVCTAKEVFIAEDELGNKIIDATVVGDDDCAFPGDTATVAVVANIHYNADRFDNGVYSALDGGDALRGMCAVDVLPNMPSPATDLDGDMCGDVITGGGGADFVDFTFQTLTLTCVDDDGDGFLDFSVCFSWRTSGNNEPCFSGDDVFPGTKSKCFCETANLPVAVPPASLQVVKTANPTSVEEPGDEVIFTVTVTNNGIDPGNSVTVNSLIDDIHGDLDGRGTCSVPQILSGNGGSYSCSFTATVSGDAGDSETDTVTASGTDTRGNPVSGFDDATVTITGVPPDITVVKTADPIEVMEPGGLVTFDVTVTNNSVSTDPVTIDSLIDNVHGDLDGQGTCSVPQVLAGEGGTYSCSFTATVSGNAGYVETDTVTASGADDEGSPVSDSDSAVVTVLDVPSMCSVQKSANPTEVDEPGGEVDFTVTVTNTSLVDTVTIDSLMDDVHGNLNGRGDCSVPQMLGPNGSFTCTFTATVSGNAGDSETDTAMASGVDDDGNDIDCVADTATVTVENVPPAARLTKTATTVLVTYTVEVVNESAAEALTLSALVDDQYGDLDGQGTCSVPQVLQPLGMEGDTYTCEFTAEAPAPGLCDTVTGTVSDDEGETITPSDSEDVSFGDVDSCEP